MKSTSIATPLQRDLVRRIAARLADGAVAGTQVVEARLAAEFAVSRTPIRAALLALAAEGVLRHQANRGFVVVRRPEPPAAEPDLADRMLTARATGRLAQEVSEAALMTAFGETRGTVRRALLRLAEIGLARRAAGHGWQFAPALEDAAARAESRAFRIAVEPAALMQAGWRAEPGYLARLAAEQRALLKSRGGTPEGWSRANAAFHEGLAACSGNRFLLDAVRAQNALRRLNEYSRFPALGQARIRQSCREHLGILAALEEGDRPRAALLMEAHIRAARGPD